MSIVVLKVGGASTGGVGDAVAALRATGYSVCVVHGAGPQISEEMARRGLDVEFVDGRRVTTADGLEVVRESLAAVNAAVCVAIGADAVALAGDEAGLEAQQIPELGLVGRPLPAQVGDRIGEVPEGHRIDARERRLGCRVQRAEQALDPHPPSALRNREHAADTP